MPQLRPGAAKLKKKYFTPHMQYLVHLVDSSPDLGFPCGSAGKEFACNTGSPGSIPVLGRSPGEGIDNPFQYSWASLVAQMVKNPPTMWEMWV